MIFGALQVTKVLSTEEVKRAIEGPGKDFGKSRSYDTKSHCFDGFRSYFRLGLTHFELTVGQEMEIY